VERIFVIGGGTGALGSAVVEATLLAGHRAVVPWIVENERKALEKSHGEEAAAGRLVLVRADVADEAGARAAVEAAGAPDVLVNGVGGFAGGKPFVETPLEDWDRMYRMNVRSAAALSRAAVPGMLARGRGVIVNVAAQPAFDCPPNLAAYSASKAALVALTKTLDAEVGPRGVRVNAVVPTTIDTPANSAAMPDADWSAWTRPEAIAGVILWLASDAARSVSGALLPV
jgi:NAD(P)-dependent dehydrogenase (short-subunit alcohol dehydrogenase family)